MIVSRKDDHLRICLQENVRPAHPGTGLDRYGFLHQALPDLDLAQVSLQTAFLGKQLALPLLLSSMSGGTPAARAINRRLAEAAQHLGAAMGVGSQRAGLESPELAGTYQVRDVAPDILLLANLGAVQLNYGYTADHCQRAVDMIEADALILHLNPLQEAIQPDGDTNFAGLLDRIEAVCHALSVPVVAKEVGCGLSAQAARQLIDAGVSALDVAGAGGTSWSEVERHRACSSLQDRVAVQFAGWGIPTAQSLRLVSGAVPGAPLIASGGISTGIDVAKCLALGADLVGLAWPLLRPAMRSHEAVIETVEPIAEALRTAMFCIGAPDVAALQGTPYLEEIQR